MNQGKLSFREIGTRNTEIKFDESDGWVRDALQKAAPHGELSGMTAEEWASSATCRGETRIERLDPEYAVEGNFSARVPILCPRCGEPGTAPREGQFRLFVRQVGPREVVEEGDDPDYIFLDTPWLDLSDVLAEQIVAVEPVVEYPDLDGSGSPHTCEAPATIGADDADSPLTTTRQNVAKAGNSPFAVLEQLKDTEPNGKVGSKPVKKR